MNQAQRDDLVVDIAARFRAAQIARDPDSDVRQSATTSESSDLDARAFDRAERFVEEGERRGLIKPDPVAPV